MQSIWLKGHKDKATRKEQVRGYKFAFDQLKKILEEEYKKKSSVRDYEEPNWELRQIAVNEYNQVLEDILKLITIEE